MSCRLDEMEEQELTTLVDQAFRGPTKPIKGPHQHFGGHAS